MRPADQLAAFVHDALTAGKSRKDIETALGQAGWAPNEVRDALNAWAESDFTPPVPKPRAYVSAKEAFFYGLMFIALGWTTWHLITLSFNLIDRWLPVELGAEDYYYSLSEMRFSIASLIVFAPLFVMLSLRTARATRKDPGMRRSGVRKWFGYVTMFLAAISLLGDLIAAIYVFLSGDLTTRFLLKAIVVAVVAGAIFLFFRHETMGDENA